MKNLKMSVKLIVCFSIIIVFAVLSTISGLVGMNRVKNATHDMYTYNILSIDAIGLIRENYALQRFTSRELIIYTSESIEHKNAKESLKELDNKMNIYMNLYAKTILTDNDKLLFDEFKNLYYDEYVSYRDEFIRLADLDQKEAAVKLIENVGTSIRTRMINTLQEAYDANNAAIEVALMQNEALYSSIERIEIVVLLVAIVVGVLLVIYLRKMISIPLKALSNSLNYMGSTGDLELKFSENMVFYSHKDLQRTDEIGMASRAVIDLLSHVWNVERILAHISNGDFDTEIEMLSDKDTLGGSVAKVAKNLKTMFDSLKTAEEAAQAASNAKGVFLAHVSHEIRTPLNAIIGMATIAKRADGDYIKTQASIEQIIASSHHLLSLLNNVLDMSKIESGKLELTKEPFQLHAAFNDVNGIISLSCSAKSITFTTNIDQLKDMTLFGDKMRINQVLINLLGNAVKFTGDNGEIKLNLTILEESENNVCFRYTISDNGIGMSKEQLSKLFKPFEQTDRTIASRYGGTGLGLSISWNIVEMMGGTITVQSEPGIGSIFYLDLCLEKGTLVYKDSVQANRMFSLQSKHILLVEDIEVNRIIMCELLGDTGAIIDQAENGKQALDMFVSSANGFYDLIIMDIQMPEMDGFTATQIIRGLERADAKNVPIVAMTANTYKEDVERCLLAGMNSHLSKPIDYDSLVTTILRFINE